MSKLSLLSAMTILIYYSSLKWLIIFTITISFTMILIRVEVPPLYNSLPGIYLLIVDMDFIKNMLEELERWYEIYKTRMTIMEGLFLFLPFTDKCNDYFVYYVLLTMSVSYGFIFYRGDNSWGNFTLGLNMFISCITAFRMD